MLFLNNEKVEIKEFPNGESFITRENLKFLNDINEIKLIFQNDKDIMHLVFLKGYLDEKNLKAKLILPYMPYSRMDRTEGFTVFTLKYLCKLINSMNFTMVTIYEPHSDVSVALLDRVEVVNMSKILAEELLNKLNDENIYMVYPDAGAEKRYSKQIEYDKVLTATKSRDFKTGYIKSLEINGRPKDEFTAIIVDDLCSRGGTFMLTASKLKEIGAKDIYLVVTHCEDTVFEGDLLDCDFIKKVYTTNSILSKKHEKIVIKNI